MEHETVFHLHGEDTWEDPQIRGGKEYYASFLEASTYIRGSTSHVLPVIPILLLIISYIIYSRKINQETTAEEISFIHTG
jgi:hypothetical protein